MNLTFIKCFKYIFTLISIFGAFTLYASESNGTISSTNFTAQVCETPSCSVSSTSPVNFGYFTTATTADVTINDTELTGFIWGKSFGWAVLNCVNTTSGCSSTNGNFKVANNDGTLSGYAWGDNAGWINFGPFLNSTTSPIVINSSGQFNGYAWSQNYGWIKFDCSDSNYCVSTDWRPLSARTVVTPPGPSGHPPIIPPVVPPVTPPVTPPITPPVVPPVTPPVTPVIVEPVTPPAVTPPIAPPEILPVTPTVAPTTTVTSTSSNNVGSFVSSFLNGNIFPITQNSVNKILDNLNKSTQSTKATVKKVTTKTSEVLNTPAGAIATTTVTAVGAVSGISFSLIASMFANPLSLSEIFLIPIRLWGLLMTALGLKKRNRPWGTVYDSVTKQPLDPAYVVLQDLNGNEIATSITDLDGRYGFLVQPGQYKMIANKTNYNFPSKNLAGKTSDEIYQELYFSEVINLTSGGVISKNIPMDPIKFDWNEFAKKQQSLMKFYSKRDVWIARISNFLFAFGFLVTTIAVLVSPKTYNIITFIVYIALFVLKHTVLKPKQFGNLKSKETGIPLSFAIIRVFSVGAEHEVIHKIADKNGEYYCLVPNGLYYIKIEKKNLDGSYTLIYTSEPIEVKEGYINKVFEI